MKINKFLFVIVIVSAPFVSQAQSKASRVNRIGIGDRVPDDMPLMNMVNYPKRYAHIGDFKGKWLILDYWFTGCGPCIDSWPKLMQLQKRYGDYIQIVGVNHMQGREIVEDFIMRRNKVSKEPFLIPSVTGDTALHKILPPFGYPSVVWIDPDGVYRASTDGKDLSEDNIRLALNNKSIATLAANTSYINLKRPLFIDGNGGTGGQMLFYSTVSQYSDKLGNGSFLMSADSSGYVIATTHKTIFDLITRAYCEGPIDNDLVNYIRLPPPRIQMQVKDPDRLLSVMNGKRTTDNLYTYQLISYEPRPIEQLKAIMRDDIQKYFGLELKWKKVTKKCLVLTAQDTTLLGDSSLKRPLYASDKTGIEFIRDVPVRHFFGYLTEFIGGVYNNLDGYPLIDETGFKGGLDLVFDGVTDQNRRQILSDYRKFNVILAKYKMEFKLEDRQVDVLMIMDAGIE